MRPADPLEGQSPRPNLLRELSEQAVLEAIFREGPMTRPEIAARTGISKPTVSAVVDRLVRARLVQPAGERPGRGGGTPPALPVKAPAGRGGGGRAPPLAFTVNASAGYVIGIDIGSTRLRVEAVDIYGERLAGLEL